MKTTAIASLIAIAAIDLARLEQILRIAAYLMPIVVGVVHALRRPPRRESKPRRTQSTLPLAVAGCALALLFGSGCVKSSMAELVRAVGSDTNAVSISVRSPWGTVEVHRNDPASR